MITHRYHLPHYQQVAVYFWPILFFELWRVDLWQNETGRLAFVIPDKYGRAWVKYFEGMSIKPHVNDMYEPVYKPADVEELCPGVLENALATFSVDASASRGLRTSISYLALGTFMLWTPAYAGVCGVFEHLEPG
ncbi:MAG: hypothetical protein AAFV59_10550 [Pseudomonadota bacterium]